jgi:hypothetical protein
MTTVRLHVRKHEWRSADTPQPWQGCLGRHAEPTPLVGRARSTEQTLARMAALVPSKWGWCVPRIRPDESSRRRAQACANTIPLE